MTTTIKSEFIAFLNKIHDPIQSVSSSIFPTYVVIDFSNYGISGKKKVNDFVDNLRKNHTETFEIIERSPGKVSIHVLDGSGDATYVFHNTAIYFAMQRMVHIKEQELECSEALIAVLERARNDGFKIK